MPEFSLVGCEHLQTPYHMSAMVYVNQQRQSVCGDTHWGQSEGAARKAACMHSVQLQASTTL